MYKTFLAVTAMLLMSAGVSLAQPKGVAARDISRQLPLEGAPLAVPGPYKVASEAAFGSPGHVVFHPETLDAFPSKDSLPVMVWGNGGCAIDSTRYGGFLSTIASHGFVVISTAAQEGAQRRTSTADDLRAGVDWAFAENTRAASPLKGKLALDKVAVMGTSCGGFLSLTLGGDPRVKTIGVLNSGIAEEGNAVTSTQPGADVLAKLHGPVLLINGGEVDFMMGPSLSTYEKITNLPAFYGARDNAGHSATIFHPGGGEFANVSSNWLMWTLKGDKKAGKMFVGADCELCTNPNWDTRSKGIK